MNITLIGMPGVGKSSIGKQLAKSLQFTFLDSDHIIEKTAKMSLQQIIDLDGEAAFLDLEKKTIINLGDIDNYVLCPGGSVVYSDEAMLFLKKHSLIVFLDKKLENIKAQIPDIAMRGIIGLKGMSLQDLYIQRRPLYEKYADISLKLSSNSDVLVHSKEIIAAILKHN
ncbi:MAG: shikimate kinase [Candidatus Omnitrophota bacterium]